VIQNLSELTHLRELDLSLNHITACEGLGSLVALTDLNISNNCLTTLKGLGYLPNLFKLDASLNKLSTLHGLEGNTSLRILNVAVNNLESLAGLQHLKALGELLARKNKITNALPLSHMNDLFSVDLSANNIVSLTEVLSVCKSLRNLRVLHLNGNPLCDDDHYIASVATHTEVTELDGEIITKNAAMGLISEKKADDADGAIKQARGAYESRMEFERRKMDMKLKTLHAEELEMLTSFNAYERQEEDNMKKQMEYIMDKTNEDTLPDVANIEIAAPIVMAPATPPPLDGLFEPENPGRAGTPDPVEDLERQVTRIMARPSISVDMIESATINEMEGQRLFKELARFCMRQVKNAVQVPAVPAPQAPQSPASLAEPSNPIPQQQRLSANLPTPSPEQPRKQSSPPPHQAESPTEPHAGPAEPQGPPAIPAAKPKKPVMRVIKRKADQPLGMGFETLGEIKTITRCIEGKSAWLGKVRVGDRILKIQGKDAAPLTHDEVGAAFKAAGKKIKMLVEPAD